MAYKNKEDQKAAAHRHYEQNRKAIIERARIYNRKLIADLRKEVITLKETTPCTDCNQKYPFYVMQFDHIKGEKLFDIGRSEKWTSRRKLFEEIEKCSIVCANCHAERTYNRSNTVPE